uniref:Uncharacterized protein n=1 Tax=Daucus carota subsp. sativus TaxID=79200 RepID=A0A161ZKK8_DAUCS
MCTWCSYLHDSRMYKLGGAGPYGANWLWCCGFVIALSCSFLMSVVRAGPNESSFELGVIRAEGN